jgi:hypothetical protein
MPYDHLDASAGIPSEPVPQLPEPGTAEQESSPAEISPGLGASRLPAIIAGVVAAVILAALIAVGVLLFNHPQAAAVLRDIFIILLGIQSIIIGLLLVAMLVVLIYMALKIYDLTQFVEDELRPILGRADDMMRTAHSRTVFISDTAVKPVIGAMGFVSAVKSIIRSFTRSSR